MELAAAIFVDDLDLTWRALARFGIAAPAGKRPCATARTLAITGVRKPSVRYEIVLHIKPWISIKKGAAIAPSFNEPEPSATTNAIAWLATPTSSKARYSIE